MFCLAEKRMPFSKASANLGKTSSGRDQEVRNKPVFDGTATCLATTGKEKKGGGW